MNHIKLLTQCAYDIQLVRIKSGLRLCASFRSRMGKPEFSVDEIDAIGETDEIPDSGKSIIDDVLAEYREMTKSKKSSRLLPPPADFVEGSLIKTYSELVMVDQYSTLLTRERSSFRAILECLESSPIYRQWLSKQIGVGPAMAGVLIGWFDPHKAVRPSQYWALAGLDVGPGNLARSKRKDHLIARQYTSRSGELKSRMSTTFDPWLQSRLLGVLSASLLRVGSPYRKYYDGYRHRIETDPSRRKGTLADKRREQSDDIWHPLRIHRASLRYMVKMFIADFWRQSRLILSLPIVPTYHESIQGHVHHGNKRTNSHVEARNHKSPASQSDTEHAGATSTTTAAVK